MNCCRLSSATLSTELFRLMPYLCQFTGTERDQDVAQACLQVRRAILINKKTSRNINLP